MAPNVAIIKFNKINKNVLRILLYNSYMSIKNKVKVQKVVMNINFVSDRYFGFRAK